MKIGDKVKFLSETGGGRIAGFQGKNTVLVEDEDGFQIPTPVNEVVVVETEDYTTANVINKRAEAEERRAQETPLRRGGRSVKAMMQDGEDEAIDLSVPDTIAPDTQVTFRPKAEERQGGNQLSAYLAFVPMEDNRLDEPHFEAYFVNDSNYAIHYALMKAEGASWTLISAEEVEPNTQVFLQELNREIINRVGRISFLLTAYKREKPFLLKEPASIDLRLDPRKFYKVHTFEQTPFFEQPVLLYALMKNDEPARPLAVDPKRLKEKMYKGEEEKQKASQNGSRRDQLVRRYGNDQSKGNPKHTPYIRHRGLDDAEVIDLHADQLLETTKGMSPHDILDYQLDIVRKTLAKYAGKKGQKLIFIHGKGQGVLRSAIINELRYHYKTYPYQDASFQEYGYGATQVTIK